MQKIKQLLIFLSTVICTHAQSKIDSLKKQITSANADSVKIFLYEDLGQTYRDAKRMDSAVWCYKQALTINEKVNYSLPKQCWNIACIDYILFEMGDYLESLKYAKQHLELSSRLNDAGQQGAAYLVFGHDYREMEDYRNSLNNYFKAYHFWDIFHEKQHERPDNTYTLLCIALTYLKMGKPDSALFYTNQRLRYATATSSGGLILLAERILGDIYFAKGDDETALKYYRQYVPDYVKYRERNRDLGFVLNSMAGIFQKRGQYDSAKYYAKKALANAEHFHDQQNIYTASTILYNSYKIKKDDIIPSDTTDDLTNDKKLVAGDIIVDEKEVSKNIDRLRNILNAAKEDTIKYKILRQMGDQYVQINKYDSGIQCGQQALELLRKNKHPIIEESWTLQFLEYWTYVTGNFLLSINYAEQILQLSQKIDDAHGLAWSLSILGVNYEGLGDYRRAIDYLLKGKKQMERFESGHWAIQNLAEVYLKMHRLDSALYYNKIAYHIADTGHNQRYMIDFAIRVYAFIYAEKGDDQLSLKYFRQFVSDFYKYNLNNREIGHAYLGMAKIFQKNDQIDSSIFYAKKALASANRYDDPEYIFNASNFLYSLHDSLRNESDAFKYFKIAVAAKDSMASIEKIRQIQNLAYEEQVREKEEANADAKEKARIRLVIVVSAIFVLLVSFLIWNRIRQLRLRYKTILEQKEAEKLKAKYDKELLALEARALRAQMNPHFVFNCLNSIKSLIQQHDEEKSVIYLTTFSKLIRTLFNNADKKEISLYDEIETCKLYLQLEAMRFDARFFYSVNVDNNIDLKSIQVPALIIQPFVENAIWHGIVPRNSAGHISLNVMNKNSGVEIIIDDDGIGRETSQQNKSASALTHKSKGVNLTQSRLELNNLLQQRQAELGIIDKKDQNGIAIGTTVIIKIKEEV